MPGRSEPPKDIEQAGAYLNVTPRMMRRLQAERRIPYYKVGKHVRFDVRDLDAFWDAARVPAKTA